MRNMTFLALKTAWVHFSSYICRRYANRTALRIEDKQGKHLPTLSRSGEGMRHFEVLIITYVKTSLSLCLIKHHGLK
jgi:hypothetical protein